jgi:hypothetical protein
MLYAQRKKVLGQFDTAIFVQFDIELIQSQRQRAQQQ